MVYYDKNQKQRDIVGIMSDHGFNIIHLRMFVDPSAQNMHRLLRRAFKGSRTNPEEQP
jgi:arabinogalactan endo-1,4-beta-galactosidase